MNEMKIANQTVYFKSAEHMDELKSNSVTLIVTSPPYWNVRDYGNIEQIGFGQSYKQYIESLNRVWKECVRVLQPNGKIAINLQPLPISADYSGFNRRVIQNIMWDIEKFMRENDLYLSGMQYWDKAAYVSNVSWGSYPKPTNIASNTGFEQIFVWVKRGKTRKIDKIVLENNILQKEEWRHWAVRCIWDDIAPVIKFNSKGEDKFGHPAPFPEDIPYRLIRMHTVEGETVLDPFLGSGTTLKISRFLNRQGIGYELNPKFKELIVKRIMEEWDPPGIETAYATLGSETIVKIIEKTIKMTWKLKGKGEEFLKIKNIIFSNILELLRKENIFTKNFVKKMEKKKKESQFKQIDSYFSQV